MSLSRTSKSLDCRGRGVGPSVYDHDEFIREGMEYEFLLHVVTILYRSIIVSSRDTTAAESSSENVCVCFF